MFAGLKRAYLLCNHGNMVFGGRNQDFPGDLASFGVRGLERLEGHWGEFGTKAARTRLAEAASGAALGDDGAMRQGIRRLRLRQGRFRRKKAVSGQTGKAYYIKISII